MSINKKAEIIDRAARKALIKSNVEKLAGISSAKKALGAWAGMDNTMKVVSALGAAVLLNQFVKKMVEYGSAIGLRMMKPSYYEKMVDKHPGLLKEDPEEVMDLWDTLYHNAPHLAQDPIAAGAFITQNIQARTREDMGGPPIDTYATLNKIEGDARSNKEAKDPGLTSLFAGSTLFL